MSYKLDISCFGHPFTNYPHCEEQCDTGRDITDSPFVSLKRAADLADEEVVTGRELFKKLHDASLKKVANQFIQLLSKDFQFNSVVEKKARGNIGDFTDVFDGQIGFKIEKCSHKYQCLNIETLRVKSDIKTTKIIYIEDGCDTIEKKFKLKCGVNDLRIDYWTKSEDVRIYLNACNIKLANGSDCCSELYLGKACFNNCSFCCGDFEIDEFRNDGTEVLASTGLEIYVRSVCDPYQIAYDYKHLLGEAHELYFEYMIHQTHISSQRMSPFVRNQKDVAKMRMKEIMGGINDGFVVENPLYHAAMKLAAQSAKNSIGDSPCVTCQGNKIVKVKP